jgi:hypothetical protein
MDKLFPLAMRTRNLFAPDRCSVHSPRLPYYGIRGLLPNAPLEGASWNIEDVISEVRANLAKDSGHFNRVFLYLAYNEGQPFTLYP